MPHVVVAGPIHEAGLAVLRDAPEITFETADGPDAFTTRIYGADALLIRTQLLPGPVIATAQRLQIVSRHGVGYDAVDVPALDARGIPLTIVGDVNSRTVAEHTMALMLSLAKRVPAYDRATRSGDWTIRNSFSAVELWGKSLFVVGFGRIGRLVGGMASAFGMRVLAFDPFLDADTIRAAGAEPVSDLETGLRAADVVTLHLPKAGARPLIGADELAACKPAAFLINTARGGLVDEQALVVALEAGRLAGAGLDVFATEPPAADSRLLANDRVILSPHSAGLTEECAIRMGEVSARNIVDYFAGRLDPSLIVNNAPAARTPAP